MSKLNHGRLRASVISMGLLLTLPAHAQESLGRSVVSVDRRVLADPKVLRDLEVALQDANPRARTVSFADAAGVLPEPTNRLGRAIFELGLRGSLIEELKRECGESRPHLLKAALELNPPERLSSPDSRLVLPPCVTTLNHPGDGEQVEFPVEADAIRVQQVLDEANLNAEAFADRRLQPVSTTQELAPADASCHDPEMTDPAVWPFPRATVAALVDEYLDRMLRANEEYKVSVVAIVDTGIDSAAAWRLPFLKSRMGEPESGSWCVGINGCNLATKGPTAIAVDARNSGHGLAVASIAAGIASADVLASGLVRLRSYTIEDAEGRRWSSDLAQSVRAARSKPFLDYATNAAVLNWSWQGKDSSDSLDSAVMESDNLIVAAAGNTKSIRIDGQVTVPARLAGKGNVLTVAALRPDQQLASFSSRATNDEDIDEVRLAAPGCGVRALSITGQWQPVHGTSIATPVVTFTAALLMALNPHQTHSWVRQRIEVAATRAPLLSKEVNGGRVLDVYAALAVKDDLLKLRDGRTLRGTSLQKTTVFLSGEGDVSRLLRRLDQPSARDGKWYATATLQDCEPNGKQHRAWATREGEVLIEAGELRFEELSSGTVTSHPWAEIEHFIPRPPADSLKRGCG